MAVAIAARIVRGNNRRAPNHLHYREACSSTEDEYFALRLRQHEVHVFVRFITFDVIVYAP
mgnify:FL=1